MFFRKFICIVFCCCATFAAQGQKFADLKAEGEKYYANKKWTEALQAFTACQQQKPGDPAVLARLGICHYRLQQGAKARQLLEYVIARNPATTDLDVYFFLARTLHGQEEYSKAMDLYKMFLRVAPADNSRRANVCDNLRRCLTALDLPANEAVALAENLGELVNTPGDEFAPLPSVNFANRLYFATAHTASVGGLRNEQGYEDVLGGRYCADIFQTNLGSGGWESAKPLSSLVNTARHEIPLDFSTDGRVLYYSRGFTDYSGDIMADTANTRDEYAISPPRFQSAMRPEMGDQTPFFCNDSTLLFASRRDSGLGGLDLYLSKFRGGTWTKPQNLGATVNSGYDETAPFLSRDGRTLYFSSNGLNSIGGFDVFKSVFDDATQTWSAPVNLGSPVNSPGDDTGFRLSADGKTAFFASERLENFGGRDLYIAYFKEAQNEQLQTRTPALFCDAPQAASAAPTAAVKKKITLVPLLYDNDRTVLKPENIALIDAFAAQAREYPALQVVVTTHTDETGPAKFDLYYGIKRAEMVAKALTERNIDPKRMVLRSAGAGFPLARNVLGASANPEGRRLNRRIELSLTPPVGGALPFEVELQRPVVPEDMQASGTARLDEMMAGLCYKVEIAATRQVFTNDALELFDDLLIESQAGSGLYRYSGGLLRNHADAIALRKTALEQGLKDAVITAYINGLPISKADAIGLLKKFPGLTEYIKR